jgi:hypothetical protein
VQVPRPTDAKLTFKPDHHSWAGHQDLMSFLHRFGLQLCDIAALRRRRDNRARHADFIFVRQGSEPLVNAL